MRSIRIGSRRWGRTFNALEREFAEKIGGGEVVALSTGTAALHLSLILLGIKPGDDVAVSTFTFAATANAVAYLVAKPVFIDCDRETWNMDPTLLAEELEDGRRRGRLPKAVIVVDLYGQCADYKRILDTCRDYHVPVIEDAAEALGALYGGLPAGSFGEIACFSFNGNKIITASGGGMLVARRRDWAERACFLAPGTCSCPPLRAHGDRLQLPHEQPVGGGGEGAAPGARGTGGAAACELRVLPQRTRGSCGDRVHARAPGGPIDAVADVHYRRSGRVRREPRRDSVGFGTREYREPPGVETDALAARVLGLPGAGGAVSADLFERGLCLPSGSSLKECDRERVVGVVRGTGVRS